MGFQHKSWGSMQQVRIYNYSRTHLTGVDPRNLPPCDATWNIWRFGRGISQVSLAYDVI